MMMISLSDMIANIVGKGKNAGYQYFLLFPTMFSEFICLSGKELKRWTNGQNVLARVSKGSIMLIVKPSCLVCHISFSL